MIGFPAEHAPVLLSSTSTKLASDEIGVAAPAAKQRMVPSMHIQFCIEGPLCFFYFCIFLSLYVSFSFWFLSLPTAISAGLVVLRGFSTVSTLGVSCRVLT